MTDEEYLAKCMKKAYKINKEFWGFDINYKASYVLTREDMDKWCGSKTEKWVVASAWEKKIIIFGASVYEKISSHKLESYQDTVTHELNHLFYQEFVGTYKPLWINEGLALLIQSKSGVKEKKVDPKYLVYNGNEVKEGLKIYTNSYLAVKFLIQEIGKEKLLELLKIYSKNKTKENYLKIFGKYLEMF